MHFDAHFSCGTGQRTAGRLGPRRPRHSASAAAAVVVLVVCSSAVRQSEEATDVVSAGCCHRPLHHIIDRSSATALRRWRGGMRQ
uniref:Uncharacterized protein n=1 Tax=Anopheles albimanus TaxID=7167 RepID=A0A182FYZ5_ANOAL